MSDSPLAFFISFTTYGAWLHGKDPGSVDPDHNEFGTPFLPVDPAEEQAERANMKQPPYLLDDAQQRVVLATIQEVCRHRGWRLLACHMRTTHVHSVVAGDAPPEKMMNDFKAYASRRLTEAGFETSERKRWTRHGSTKYIWQNDYLSNAVNYVLNKQGAVMQRYAADTAWLR